MASIKYISMRPKPFWYTGSRHRIKNIIEITNRYHVIDDYCRDYIQKFDTIQIDTKHMLRVAKYIHKSDKLQFKRQFNKQKSIKAKVKESP